MGEREREEQAKDGDGDADDVGWEEGIGEKQEEDEL